MIQKIKEVFLKFFNDEENLDEPIYDPMHIGALIVISLSAMGALFWLLWTLLVFEGGIFVKIIPTFQVLFTEKKLQDFGWVGYPFELGIFEGGIANSVALLITIALLIGLWWVFKKQENLQK